jgi:hypothetical protein
MHPEHLRLCRPFDGNAKGHPAHADTARTGTPNPPDYPLLSIQDISTTMNKVDNAIADLELRDHVEPYVYDEVANEYGRSGSAAASKAAREMKEAQKAERERG